MAFCVNCGAELNDGAKFCSECGAANINLKNNGKRKEIYDGEVHKCPNCGEVLKAFSTTCPSCGYELRGAKAGSSVAVLARKLEKVESIEEKLELISNFYIPNTREDIYEFFILATSNIQAGGYGIDAWYVKLEQAFQKAKLSFGDTTEFEYLKQLYAKTKKKRVLKSIGGDSKKLKGILLMVFCFIGIILAIIGVFADQTFILTSLGVLVIVLGVLGMSFNKD